MINILVEKMCEENIPFPDQFLFPFLTKAIVQRIPEHHILNPLNRKRKMSTNPLKLNIYIL